MERIIINAVRQGYGTDQIDETMTVGELIEILSNYDESTPVFLGHDMKSYGWYTYGGITERDIFDDDSIAEAFGEEYDD